jgi:hypothetical protein
LTYSICYLSPDYLSSYDKGLHDFFPLSFEAIFLKQNQLLMKKLVLTLCAICAFAVASFAQGVSFGAKAGVNIAKQKWEAQGISVSPDALTGFHVGGFATIMFSESFGLQPELLFSIVGAKMDFGSGDDSSLKMSYISVPVMFRYQPVEIFNLHAGPQFGFLASAKAESDGDSEDVKEAFKGLDLGLGFGAGVDLPMGLGFTARYVLGLSNISEGDEDFGDEITMKNNVFQLSVTYRFGGAE